MLVLACPAWPFKSLPSWILLFQDPTRLATLGFILGALGFLSVLGLPFLLARIPADYFSRPPTPARPGSLVWFGRFIRNLFGVFLMISGIAMLVLPGQGLLTILVALVFLDFPRKRPLERWLLTRPRVLDVLNSLRARAGRPPFELETSTSTQPSKNDETNLT